MRPGRALPLPPAPLSPAMDNLQDTDGQILIPSTLWETQIIAPATDASWATVAAALGPLRILITGDSLRR
jgi:hypothetical protein